MKDTDFDFIERFFETVLIDATKTDFSRIKQILYAVEQQVEGKKRTPKVIQRQNRESECNILIERGELHKSSKVVMFYNHKLVECIVDAVPITRLKHLKVQFINPEGAGSSKPIKYMPKEYFHRIIIEKF